MLILVSCFVIPVSAAIPDTFGDYHNLLDFDDRKGARFYTSPTEYEPYNFFEVNLKPDTDYTFYSTLGSNRFYFGANVLYNDYSSAFSFDSMNLFYPTNFFKNSNSISYSYDFYTNSLHLTSLNNLGNYEFIGVPISVTPGTVYNISCRISGGTDSSCVRVVKNRSSSGSDILGFITLDNESLTFTVPEGVYEISLLFYISHGSSSSANMSVDFINVSVVDDVSFSGTPLYFDPIYNDELTYVYNFRTPSSITSDTPIVIGVHDATFEDLILFSTTVSENNDLYLLEGRFTVEDLADVNLQESYQNGYNSGYDVGFSKGETSGLESSMFMRNIFFTIVSSPFIFIRNALDFDFLGINFRDIVMIIISATLVAWVIRTFKKGE